MLLKYMFSDLSGRRTHKGASWAEVLDPSLATVAPEVAASFGMVDAILVVKCALVPMATVSGLQHIRHLNALVCRVRVNLVPGERGDGIASKEALRLCHFFCLGGSPKVREEGQRRGAFREWGK
jgi:hypothetical protein